MEPLFKENKGHILLGGCEPCIHQYLMRYSKHTQAHTHSKQTQYSEEHQSYTVFKFRYIPKRFQLNIICPQEHDQSSIKRSGHDLMHDHLGLGEPMVLPVKCLFLKKKKSFNSTDSYQNGIQYVVSILVIA